MVWVTADGGNTVLNHDENSAPESGGEIALDVWWVAWTRLAM